MSTPCDRSPSWTRWEPHFIWPAIASYVLLSDGFEVFSTFIYKWSWSSKATITAILFLDMPRSFLPSFNSSLFFITGKNISSKYIVPSKTTSSWMLSSTENTLKSQYLPVDNEFLLSRAEVVIEWNSKRWIRYSIHSLIGIFFPSKIVLVNGENLFLHSLHRYCWHPFLYNPFLTICVLLQFGHLVIEIELIKAISSLELFLCFWSNHSWTVEEINSSAPFFDVLSSQGRYFREFPQWDLLFFIFGGLSLTGTHQKSRQAYRIDMFLKNSDCSFQEHIYCIIL